MLFQVGQILCQYEREKRHAIEREDFDEAKKWKVLTKTITAPVPHQFINSLLSLLFFIV